MEISYEEFSKFVRENIVTGEDEEKAVKKYLLKEFDGTEGEYIRSDHEATSFLEESDGLYLQDVRIYINVKKTTILVIACLMDAFLTRGVTMSVATALGFINKCIARVNKYQACLMSKISFYTHRGVGITESSLFAEYTGECTCLSNKRCPYWKDQRCTLSQEEIRVQLSKMMKDKVIECNVGYYSGI